MFENWKEFRGIGPAVAASLTMWALIIWLVSLLSWARIAWVVRWVVT